VEVFLVFVGIIALSIVLSIAQYLFAVARRLECFTVNHFIAALILGAILYVVGSQENEFWAIYGAVLGFLLVTKKPKIIFPVVIGGAGSFLGGKLGLRIEWAIFGAILGGLIGFQIGRLFNKEKAVTQSDMPDKQ
jgi:hypothetical protein